VSSYCTRGASFIEDREVGASKSSDNRTDYLAWRHLNDIKDGWYSSRCAGQDDVAAVEPAMRQLIGTRTRPTVAPMSITHIAHH